MTVLRHLPNAICLLRILLTVPVVLALQSESYAVALALFAVAAISDGLDGYLAKRFNWTSELGRFLDPLADKLLLVAVFLTCAWQGLVPLWLAAAAIARDVLIGAGALVFKLWFGVINGRPTLISKVNTALQIIVLIAALVQAMWWVVWPEIFAALTLLTLATTVISGGDYVARFLRRAWNPPAERR